MNDIPIKMSIAASISLCNIINKMLYDDQGKERNIPFSLKYKLIRSKDLMEKDVSFFENERNSLIREYGEEKEGTIKVKDENMEVFSSAVKDLLKIEVDHTLFKIAPKDMESIEGVDITESEMQLFIAAMIDDPLFKEDMDTPITKPSPKEEKSSEN